MSDPNNEEDFKLIVRKVSCEYINQARQDDTDKQLVVYHVYGEGFAGEFSLREDVHSRR